MTTQIPPAVLVDAAKAAIGQKVTDRDLARRLGSYGLDPVSTVDAIGRWRRGQNQPEYAATIAMLDLAGWLNRRRTEAGLAAAEAARAEAEKGEDRARDAHEGPARDDRETG